MRHYKPNFTNFTRQRLQKDNAHKAEYSDGDEITPVLQHS